MQRAIFILLNIAGGIAVLGSYVYYLQKYPELKAALWGGVPRSIQPVYTVCMFAAAAGYFLFTSYILIKIPNQLPLANINSLHSFSIIYACILIFSSLWMPFTASYIQANSTVMWLLIRVVLFMVGLASVLLLILLLRMRPVDADIWYWLAILGLIPFCLQTAVLDALVWPAYF